MKTLLLVTILVIFGIGVVNAFSASSLRGSYLSSCQPLVGLPESYRLRERVEIDVNGVMYMVSTVYNDIECDEAIIRYDRIVQLTTGGKISASQWEGTGVNTFQSPTYQVTWEAIKKLMTPLNSDGAEFANQLCPTGTSFQAGVTLDVTDRSCPGFVESCPDDTEISCVTQNSEGTLQMCYLTCKGSTPSYQYYMATSNTVYTYPQLPADSYFSLADLAGHYKRDCSPLFGLPEGWRISENSYYGADGRAKLSNTVWADSECTKPALTYYRVIQGYFGDNSGLIAGFNPNLFGSITYERPPREWATYYISKVYNDVTADGVTLLNGLCPNVNWSEGNFDIIDIDCNPFTYACNAGDHWEYLQLGLNTAGELVRFTNNIPTGSCSPADYSSSVFLAQSTPPPPTTAYTVEDASSPATNLVPFFGFFVLAFMAWFF